MWLDTPDAAMCPIPGEHQWNSTSGFSPVNTVCSDDVGAYSVYLPGLGVSAGTVQVTAYGSDAAYCKVASWGPSGTDQRVRVRCFNTTGTPTDSRFTLSYANKTGTMSTPLVYVWASQPTNPSYTPPVNYQYNSTGAINTINKVAGEVGAYIIHAPNLAAAASGGHMQVTAYGTGSEWCTTWNWGPNGSALHIQVNCYTASGAPVDTRFTMSYVRNGNILGRSVCCNSDGHPTAYLFAHNPTAASYTPADRFGIGNGTVTHPSTGRYLVNYGGVGRQGAIHVTAIGGGQARCKLESWASDVSANVLCTSPSGTPTNATFQFHHVGPFVIG